MITLNSMNEFTGMLKNRLIHYQNRLITMDQKQWLFIRLAYIWFLFVHSLTMD